jgi:DNA-binding FadR family transcriptional regulator
MRTSLVKWTFLTVYSLPERLRHWASTYRPMCRDGVFMLISEESDAIRVPKAAELVAGRIKRAIVTGDLKDGESLPSETQLMAEFQVSRPTVREGIRVLESMGLITVSRGARGGAKVTRPDAGIVASAAAMALQTRGATITDLFEARSLIEPRAARMAAERRPRAAAKVLRAHAEYEFEVINDFVVVARAIAEFHKLLMEQCGNEALAVFGIALKDVFEKSMVSAQRNIRPGRESERVASLRYGLRSHMKLADLIEAGEGKAAEAHWAVHVEKAGKIWLKSVGAKEVIDLFK